MYLAEKHNCVTRHCGNVIRDVARLSGADISLLGQDVHERVDSETIQWVQEQQCPKVVEGRYLNYVLSYCQDGLVLVRFETDIEARVQRWAGSADDNDGATTLLRSDASDAEFCIRQYPRIKPLEAHHSIDTTSLSVQGIEQELIRLLE